MFIEAIKALLLGIVEGITEWLPISSTGHLILFDRFVPINAFADADFKNLVLQVMQLGAILAVVVLYFKRLNPLSPKKSSLEKKSTWILWSKIIVAVAPGGICVIGMKILDLDIPDNPIIISAALALYGIAFIIIERMRKSKPFSIQSADDIDYKTALLIGAFQVLSIIPGTSRSGSTILGAILLGVSRTAAADFSFFLAIPAMAGASGLEVLDYVGDHGLSFTTEEITVLAVATVVSFAVSMVAIKFLTGFVRRHSFESFAWYRIAIGIVLLVYFINFV